MNAPDRNSAAYRRGRLMYVFEAALEYLISILVGGSYLATLTKRLGMSDSLTGILSSIISLGCLFQLLSVLYRRRRVKRFVVGMSVANQLMFLLLYLIPLLPLGEGTRDWRIAAFVVAIVGAYLIYNFAHPKKINWLMSLVEDSHRGRFTADKEIISLLAGMAFSFGMGALVDHFAARGELRTAFVLCAAVIFALMVLHTVTMLLTVEPPAEEETAPMKRVNFMAGVAEVFRNRAVLRVAVIFILHQIAAYAVTPFLGTYQINELGFSLTFVSFLTILSSTARILVSRFWGKYADRHSFARMIEKCLLVLILAYLCAALAVPSNGRVMFVGYNIFSGIAMGGINSALINLVFDYVTPEKRADSLAICQAGSGVMGFLTTLLISPLISLVQSRGNSVFGLTVYAQQITSTIGCLFAAFALLYVKFGIIRRSLPKQTQG